MDCLNAQIGCLNFYKKRVIKGLPTKESVSPQKNSEKVTDFR